jgi:hypothetical protein
MSCPAALASGFVLFLLVTIPPGAVANARTAAWRIQVPDLSRSAFSNDDSAIVCALLEDDEELPGPPSQAVRSGEGGLWIPSSPRSLEEHTGCSFVDRCSTRGPRAPPSSRG